MKNIYKAFNNIDINTNDYDNTELTEYEIDKFKDMVSEKIYIRKRSIYKQIAALIVLSMISFLLLNTGNVSAFLDSLDNNLKNIFNISQNKYYDNYTNIINKTVTDNSISVTFEEVLIEENQLIISSIIDYSELPKNLQKDFINNLKDISIINTLYVDNTEYRDTSSSLFEISEDKIRYISLFDIEKVPDYSLLNCSLTYKFFNVLFKDSKNGYLDKEIPGDWTFDFSIDTSNISNSKSELYLSENNILYYENGDTLKITKIEKSDISIKIYYELITKSDYYSVPPFFLIDSNKNYIDNYFYNSDYSLFFIKDSNATNTFTVSGYDHGASDNIIIDFKE